VDDDEAVLRAIQRLLGAWGFCTLSFNTGAAFLDALRMENPDCVLLDLHMPGMNAWEIMAALQSAAAPVPVIVMSGDTDPALRKTAMEKGAAAFLFKPFGKPELMEAIASVTRGPDGAAFPH
jgi:FixJ family two-component response regulator